MKRININCTTQKGITLIALVITIIILLILAGVGINMAISSEGLFARAKEAAAKWNNGVANEEQIMQNLFAPPPVTEEKEKYAPTVSQVIATRKYEGGKHIITLQIIGEDTDGENLNYVVNYGTEENNYSLKTEEISGKPGQTVEINLSNLKEYTRYYYNIVTTDEDGLTAENTGNLKTYCVGSYCSGKSSEQCSTCLGKGYLEVSCPGVITKLQIDSLEGGSDMWDCANCGKDLSGVAHCYCGRVLCSVNEDHERGVGYWCCSEACVRECAKKEGLTVGSKCWVKDEQVECTNSDCNSRLDKCKLWTRFTIWQITL